MSTVQAKPGASIVIKKLDQNLKLQQISNVNSTNLTDGYGLVYNAATNQFVFSPLSVVTGNLDGGTY